MLRAGNKLWGSFRRSSALYDNDLCGGIGFSCFKGRGGCLGVSGDGIG